MKISNREDKIQTLLRNAFHCSKSSCSCGSNISNFLKTDKISLQWAKQIKNILTRGYKIKEKLDETRRKTHRPVRDMENA